MDKSRAITILHAIATFVLACLLVYVGTLVADEYGLPLIHGWALAHGAILIVFPVYLLLSYFLLVPLVRPLRMRYAMDGAKTKKSVSLLAVWSLLLAGLGFLVPVVISLASVILGHIARRRCKAQSDFSGAGIALIGLILGYMGLAYSLYIFGMASWA